MAQRAQRILEIRGDAVDPWESAPIAHRLGRLRQPTGRQHRLPPRLVRVHAPADVLGRLHLEMGLELGAEIRVGAPTGEEASDARERGAQGSKDAHGASRFGERKAAIKSAV